MKVSTWYLGDMMRTLRICWIFVKELVREPAGVFWSTAFPMFLYVFLLQRTVGLPEGAKSLDEASALVVAYIAFMNALYGSSLYVVGRRESGFLRAFVQGETARIKFIVAQFAGCAVLCSVYTLIFLLIKNVLSPMTVARSLQVLLTALMVNLLFQWAGLCLATFRLGYQSMSNLVAIIVTPMVLFAFVPIGDSAADTSIAWLNKCNPLMFATSMILHGWDFIAENVTFSLIYLGTLFVLGGLGYRYMALVPVWNR